MEVKIIVPKFPNGIAIGEERENLAVPVVVDYTAWVEQHGAGALQILLQRPQDADPYPVTVTNDNGEAVWTPNETDMNFKGRGEIQLVYTAGDVIERSPVIMVISGRSLVAAGDPPDPFETWLEELTELAAETQQSALDAAESAEAAETSAEAAAGSAGAAAQSALDAEAAKTGAETASTTAGQSATLAGEKAAQAAQSAQTAAQKATDAQQSAEDAQTASTAARLAADAAETFADNAEAASDEANQAKDDAQSAASAAAASASAASGSAADAAATVTEVETKGAEQIAAINQAGATQIAAVDAAGAAQVQAIEDKGEEVIASIPSDYTELADEVSDLKSAFDKSIDTLFLEFKPGYYSVPSSGNTLNLNNAPTASDTIVYAIANITEITPVYLNISGGGSTSGGARAWAFLDENNVVLGRASTNETISNSLLYPYIGAKKVLIQTKLSYTGYYARIDQLQPDRINQVIDKQQKALAIASNRLFDTTWERKTVGAGSAGDIIGTTGKRFENSTKSICTYRQQDVSMLYSVNISVDNGYRYQFCIFNKDLTKMVNYAKNETDSCTINFVPEVGYIVIILQRTDDGTITLAESEHIHISGRIIGSSLDEINERITALPSHDDNDTVYETFSAHFNSVGEVSPVVFFTDPHVYNKNVTDAARNALYDKLQKAWFNTASDCVICGGDILEGGSDDVISGGPTEAQACNQLAKFTGAMRGMFGNDYYVVFGNHDSNYKSTSFTGKAITNIMFGKEGKAYYTFAYRNTRYYIFDTWLDTGIGDMTDYRKAEASWFASQLEENDEPNIVICFHIFYNNSTHTDANIPAVIRNVIKAAQAYNARSAEFVAPWKTSEVHDYSQATGKVCYGLAGHLHADLIGEYDGFPVIMTTKALINYDTPTFDLVCGDWNAKNVYCDRVGVGGNRTLHFDPLSITSEETLTTTLADVTWETTDSAVATVADGVVTPVAAGYTIITATDESGNVEAWNVWVTT